MTELETLRSIRQLALSDEDAAAFVQQLPISSVFVRDCAAGPPITSEILNRTGALDAMAVDEMALADLNDAIAACQGRLEGRLDIVCTDGLHVISVSAQPVATGTRFDRLIAVRDITEAVQLEAALRQSKEALLALSVRGQLGEADAMRIALRDPLTELPNRRAFDAALAEACRAGPFALCLMDMDQFKQVNDSLGHQSGDALLRAVGARLQQHTRATDFVARLGGDEFAVIFAGIETEAAARDAGARLISHFQTRLSLGTLDIRAQLTGGVALGKKGTNPDDVFGAADKALHRGKGDGRGEVHSGRLDAPHLDEHDTLTRVKVMLTSCELRVRFEPVVTSDGSICGYHSIVGAEGEDTPSGFDRMVATAVKFGLGEELLERVVDATLEEAARNAIPSLHLRLPAAALGDRPVVERVLQCLRNGPMEPSNIQVLLPLGALDSTVAVLAQRFSDLQIGIILDDWDLGLHAYTLAEIGMICGAKVDATALVPLLRSRDGQKLISAAVETLTAHGVPVFAGQVHERWIADRLFSVGFSGAHGDAVRSSGGSGRRTLSAA